MVAPIPINWQVIEDAIFDWFNGQTGLTTTWADQDAPQPAYPFASLNVISGPTRVGGQDEQRFTTDLGQPAGQEVAIEIAGLREITVSCQISVARPDSTDPTKNAKHFMSIAQSSLGLVTVLEALHAAGLSVIEEGEITNIDEVIEDTWISRTNMDVRFGLAASIVERTGFIEKARISSTFSPPVDPSVEITNEDFGA